MSQRSAFAALQQLAASLTYQINDVKAKATEGQNELSKKLADDDNTLAEGDDFELFEAHDEAAMRVTASLQACHERLVEAAAHAAEALNQYKYYIDKVEQKGRNK